jgi:hypothetical protein
MTHLKLVKRNKRVTLVTVAHQTFVEVVVEMGSKCLAWVQSEPANFALKLDLLEKKSLRHVIHTKKIRIANTYIPRLAGSSKEGGFVDVWVF